MKIEIQTDAYNTKIWHKKDCPNYWHREDGPALVCGSGGEAWWYYNRKYHCSEEMPLNLFLAYVKWEYRKKHGN